MLRVSAASIADKEQPRIPMLPPSLVRFWMTCGGKGDGIQHRNSVVAPVSCCNEQSFYENVTFPVEVKFVAKLRVGVSDVTVVNLRTSTVNPFRLSAFTN